MVRIETLDPTDGTWKFVKYVERIELPPKTVKLFWLFCITQHQFELPSETIKRAVQEASLLPGSVRVVDEILLGDEFCYCIFWKNGQWLESVYEAD